MHLKISNGLLSSLRNVLQEVQVCELRCTVQKPSADSCNALHQTWQHILLQHHATQGDCSW